MTLLYLLFWTWSLGGAIYYFENNNKIPYFAINRIIYYIGIGPITWYVLILKFILNR